MTSLFGKFARFLPWTPGKRLAGRDLMGNKFYEVTNPDGGRAKRVVKYKQIDHLSDYTTGKLHLPIQWSAWLRHTRPNPPSLEELQADHDRQTRLTPLIDQIQERERLERIRQGYSSPDDHGQIHSSISSEYKVIAGPSRPSRFSSPSPAVDPSTSASSPLPSTSTSEEESRPLPHPFQGQQATYPIPTPPTPRVAPPSVPVDPTRHTSKDELRKLSEEDTRRRMKESQVRDPVDGRAQPSGLDMGGGLKPRRRGSA